MQQYDRALEDSNQAIKLDQTNMHAHLVKGVTNVQMQNYDAAIADFDTVLRLDPRHVPALHWRSTAKSKKGDDAGGHTDVMTANAINPQCARDNSFMDMGCAKSQFFNPK